MAGRINLQANDGKVLSLTAPEGMSSNTTDVVATRGYVDTKPSGFKNILINGDFRVNQRGAASKTATSSAYNYDRWYYNGTTLEQRIEEGSYKPSTTYTLSGTNVTTSQETSPASGTWTINVPTDADNVQLEEGSVATPFEQRPYGAELALCQRYYQIYRFTGWDRAHIAGGAFVQWHNSVSNTFETIFPFPVHMRSVPTGYAGKTSGIPYARVYQRGSTADATTVTTGTLYCSGLTEETGNLRYTTPTNWTAHSTLNLSLGGGAGEIIYEFDAEL